MVEEQPAQGFDRGVDYLDMKKKLVNGYHLLIKNLNDISDDKFFLRKSNMIYKKIIYNLIAITQLRNGSRISEAVNAFKKFINSENFNELVTVKIAKSEKIKHNKVTNNVTKTKIRYRKMKYPKNWIDITDDILQHVKFHIKPIENK